MSKQLINLTLAGAVDDDDPIMPNEDAFTGVLSLDGASEEDNDEERIRADNSMRRSYSTFRLQLAKEGSGICINKIV